jgi:hypothetical protein
MAPLLALITGMQCFLIFQNCGEGGLFRLDGKVVLSDGNLMSEFCF